MKLVQKKILDLFKENEKLKFNEIEKFLKIRSNMVSYHIGEMKKEKLLEKRGEYYHLTKETERHLPFFCSDGMSPLPIVLVALINKNKILLHHRIKRPYKGYLSLFGGKMFLEESLEDAAKRNIQQKANINAEFISTNCVLHERVSGENITKHGFMLFFVEMHTKETEFKESEYGRPEWFDIEDLKQKKIIPSDLWLIENKLNQKIDYVSAVMSENEGELSSFKILK